MSKSLVFADDFSKEEIFEIFRTADALADDMRQVILCYLLDKK